MQVKIAEDFLQGEQDCMDGIAHKLGMSEDYNRGYAARYQFEQIKSNQTQEIDYVSKTRK